MFKKIKRTAFNLILCSLTILGIVVFTLFFPQLSFSSIYYILSGGLIGVITYLILSFRKIEKEKKGEDKKEGEQ